MSESTPRFQSFPKVVQEECWNKVISKLVILSGRKNSRKEPRPMAIWCLRESSLQGNRILLKFAKKLNNCRGPLCFRYDFIKSQQDGGKNELSNCQLLQIYAVLIKYKKLPNKFEQFAKNELDIIEQAIYSNVEYDWNFKINE
jgi:hypothetical protein